MMSRDFIDNRLRVAFGRHTDQMLRADLTHLANPTLEGIDVGFPISFLRCSFRRRGIIRAVCWSADLRCPPGTNRFGGVRAFALREVVAVVRIGRSGEPA